MSQDYDRILKENIEELILPLAQKLLNIPAPAGLVEVPDDLQYTVERRPDFLKVVTDETGRSQYVLHLEFQTADEPRMVYRMLLYKALLLSRYELPVRQYVFYIGGKAAQMAQLLNTDDLTFQFALRNVADVPYRTFLQTDRPEEVVLAILANFGSDEPEQAVRRILTTLSALTNSQLALGRFLRQIEVLAKLRKLQDLTVKQIEKMPLVYDLKTDLRYLQGEREGIMEGFAKGLKEGREEGQQEARRRAVEGLLRLGSVSPEQIASALQISLDWVLAVRDELATDQRKRDAE